MSSNYQQDKTTRRFVSTGNPTMAERPIAVRLPVEIDLAIREMSDRSDFVRNALIEAVKLRQNKLQETK